MSSDALFGPTSGAAVGALTGPSGERQRTVPLGGIQVLRGVAALSVAFLHIEQTSGAFIGRPGVSPSPILEALPWEAGVDIFFVISGFIMVHASLALFARTGAPLVFLGRRIARVVPLYWLVTTAVLLVALAAPRLLNDPISGGWPAAVASYLFIPWQRTDGFVQPLYRLGWTLNYEMLFYLLFAPFLLLSRRPAVLGVIAAIAALAAAGQWLRPANVQLTYWTDPIIIEFAAGVAIGALRAEGVRLPRALRVAIAGAGVAAMAIVGVDHSQTRAFSYGLPAAGFVAAVGLGSAWAGGSRPARAALLLGDASYALYLTHPFAARGLREIWTRLGFGGALSILPFILVSLLASCLLAIGVHRAVERPMVRLARSSLAVRRA